MLVSFGSGSEGLACYLLFVEGRLVSMSETACLGFDCGAIYDLHFCILFDHFVFRTLGWLCDPGTGLLHRHSQVNFQSATNCLDSRLNLLLKHHRPAQLLNGRAHFLRRFPLRRKLNLRRALFLNAVQVFRERQCPQRWRVLALGATDPLELLGKRLAGPNLALELTPVQL